MNKNSIKSTLSLLATALLIIMTACSPKVNYSGGQGIPQAQATSNGNPSVTVNNQDFDGTTVVVADAYSPGPGWMVIHNQVNGGLGPPIGYTQINSGDNKNIVVKIDPNQASPLMYAMLHQDGGTVGKYEFPGPDIPVMLNGEMVSPSFTATVRTGAVNITPSVTVVDQDVTNGKVTIASVASSGPGWVAVHVQGPDGNPGIEIGYTAVKPGVTQNVVVNIDASKATPVLFVMLHTDAGEIGKYEFPGPDAPQVANGQMVNPSFKTSAPAASMVMGTSAPGTNLLVKVSNQPVVNGTIMVDEVVSAGQGWIVIYTTKGYGVPDQPIGHAAVKAGDNLMVMVPVDPTKAQGTLYAQLHVDSGAIGSFEYPGVDAPVMEGVQMIASTFTITNGQAAASPSIPGGPGVLQASITVSDQAVQNGTVTVSQVVSNGNWWLVIHRQNPDGTMGEYIGNTLLKNGINTNVVVKIDVNRATPVLYAMLHEDHGYIGVLEFPGPDIPVMVNGQMVNPTFNVTGVAQDVTINIQKVSDTVSYLTDGQGKSLYIYLKDTGGKSNCTGDCLKVWTPLLVSGRVIPGNGVAQANLSVILLPNGSHQVTYLGAPLYTYLKDVNPGDTGGQGIDGSWFLVTP